MTLADRDRAIVRLIARFKHASAAQVRELLFTDVTATPASRALRRLTDQGYLARIERRMAGGAKGGSGLYVYQLGKLGHELYREGRYTPNRAVNYHSLAIVDTYIAIVQKERAQRLTINIVSTEPDCHVEVGRYYLKPDLFLDRTRPDGSRRLYWFEVDMATESQTRIREKLARYRNAYNQADGERWPLWPLVVFVAVDKERAEELRYIIQQGDKEAQRMFRVATLESLRAADL